MIEGIIWSCLLMTMLYSFWIRGLSKVWDEKVLSFFVDIEKDSTVLRSFYDRILGRILNQTVYNPKNNNFSHINSEDKSQYLGLTTDYIVTLFKDKNEQRKLLRLI